MKTLSCGLTRAPSPATRNGAALVVVVLALGAACGGGGGPSPAGTVERPDAGAFFDRYLDGDGRVVRRDQGDDTVSEGQAYGMLLAVAAGDRERFERIWSWTGAHLLRPDGLLSWHWSGGRVVDASPASDADVDAARALVLAGRRFGAPDLTAAGARMAAAVLEHETLRAGDHLVLVAGPWAVERRIANPSYFAPCAFADLMEATGDGRWGELRDSSYRLVEGLLAGGRLPPDWASVGEDGALRPIGPPGAPGGPPRYGLDAVRLPFRLSEPCGGAGARLAARMWAHLDRSAGRGGAIAYDLDGRRVDGSDHPAALVGTAAAARAAGDHEASDSLIERAAELHGRHPTYYGGAWLALSAAGQARDGT